MYRFFTDIENIDVENKKVTITGSDVNHIKNVLRMAKGEEFSVCTDADDNEYRVMLSEYGEDTVICELLFVKRSDTELPCKVYLFQGLPKSDKMELIIQKTVELGVYAVIPVKCKRSVVKIDEKKIPSRVSRWQAISEAAAKQSKRGVIPKIYEPVTFKEALEFVKDFEVKIIPYELADNMAATRKLLEEVKPQDKVAVFIGPEGGFAPEEIEAAVKSDVTPVTLGKRILRTETAGMTVMSWFTYLLEE